MNFWERGENKDKGSGGTKGGADSWQNEQNRRQFSGDGSAADDGDRRGFDKSASAAGAAPNIAEELQRYSGKSEEQLMAELLKTAGGMKSQGKLSAADLENFYNSAALFLSREQLVRLRELINILK